MQLTVAAAAVNSVLDAVKEAVAEDSDLGGWVGGWVGVRTGWRADLWLAAPGVCGLPPGCVGKVCSSCCGEEFAPRCSVHYTVQVFCPLYCRDVMSAVVRVEVYVSCCEVSCQLCCEYCYGYLEIFKRRCLNVWRGYVCC